MVKKTIPKKIINSVKDYLEFIQQKGLPIQSAFIYGSYAKGNQRKWSDIDVCVISDNFKKGIDPWVYLWQSRRKKDVLAMIAPVGFRPKDFVNESPLVWEIKQTGVRVF